MPAQTLSTPSSFLVLIAALLCYMVYRTRFFRKLQLVQNSDDDDNDDDDYIYNNKYK